MNAPVAADPGALVRNAAPTVKAIDVGAMDLGGGHSTFGPLLQHGKAVVLGFEPQQAECERLNATARPGCRFLPFALGDGRPGTLRECSFPATSSLYEPNLKLVSEFQALPSLMQVVRRREVETHRLDDIADAAGADVLKLDVQGAELDVLRGATKTLESVLLVEAEVEFVPLYAGQPLFADVDRELRARGFVFHRFLGLMGRPFAPFVRAGDPTQSISQQLWSDAIYVREFTRFRELKPEQLLKLALVLYECYGSFDLVGLALRNYDELTGEDLGRRYMACFGAT